MSEVTEHYSHKLETRKILMKRSKGWQTGQVCWMMLEEKNQHQMSQRLQIYPRCYINRHLIPSMINTGTTTCCILVDPRHDRRSENGRVRVDPPVSRLGLKQPELPQTRIITLPSSTANTKPQLTTLTQSRNTHDVSKTGERRLYRDGACTASNSPAKIAS